jgi:ubiquinone/menaquinone biosynthesis C-methylase UbiE
MGTFTASELFASAIPFYARYRPGYPVELVDFLAARLGLDGRDRALDVGCGTGQITIPLARYVGEVVALDPLAGMLSHGRTAAQRAGITNIVWLQADSTRLAELADTHPRLSVFAASFHWTDRDTVARVLDGVLARDGAIVVICNGLAEQDRPDWVNAIAEIRTRYLGPHRRAGSDTYVHSRRSHLEALCASPFSRVERLWWSWSRELTLEQVVGLQFSYSFSTPALLGDRAQAFAADVREAVLRLHPSATVVQPIRVEVLIATRPVS